MASVTLDSYSYDMVGAIVALSNPFNTQYYQRIVVSTGLTTDGSENPPDSIVWDEFAEDSNNSNFVKVGVFGLESNTRYTLNYYALTLSYQYFYIGSIDIKTPFHPLEIESIEGVEGSGTVLKIKTPDLLSDIENLYSFLYIYDTNGNEWGCNFLEKEENTDGTYSYWFDGVGMVSGEKASCAKTYTLYVSLGDYSWNNESGYSELISNYWNYTPYPSDRLLRSTYCLSINQNGTSITCIIKDQSDNLWTEYVFGLYKNNTIIDTIVANRAGTYTFSDLENGAAYKVIAMAFYNGVEAHELSSDWKSFDVYRLTLTFTITASRPAYWSWNEEEMNAFNKGGAFKTLTAERWNAFVDNLKEVSYYKGFADEILDREIYNVPSGTTFYNFLEQAKGIKNEDFLARYFNIARHGIGSMNINGTGLVDKYSGDIAVGNDFVILQNKINEVE